jgi:chromosome transmission fidelity protein 18
MDATLSPSLPPTSDPALYDDWEEHTNAIILPSSTYSADLEALHLVQQETIARKNKEGEVIQHRAWGLADVFRSEADHLEGMLFSNWIDCNANCI